MNRACVALEWRSWQLVCIDVIVGNVAVGVVWRDGGVEGLA